MKARPRSHEIETETRRIVTSCLPANFVERDQTERDYGIDMVIEIFDDGQPSGGHILLQLKGRDATAPDGDDPIPFDLPVKHLVRTERFVVPVLLVWCPVKASPPQAWFLWLQEYIRVVLDWEAPGWRHQKSVRLKIPRENVMPSTRLDSGWPFIAQHPARLAAFGQLARLAHEARYCQGVDEFIPLFEEALTLDAIFRDARWEWGQMQRANVERGLLAAQLLRDQSLPDDETLRELGWHFPDGEEPWRDAWPVPPTMRPSGEWALPEGRERLLASLIYHSAHLLSTAGAMFNDYRMRNTVWRIAGDHDF